METITKLKELVLRKQEAQHNLNNALWANLNWYWQEQKEILNDCQEQIDKIILEA